MATFNIFYIGIALYAMQMVPCLATQTRETFFEVLMTNAVNGLNDIAANVLHSLESGITQVQSMIQELSQQSDQVLASSQGPLQKISQDFISDLAYLANSSLAFGNDVTVCVEGQEDHVKNITLQAAKNIFGCTQTQIQYAVELLADMTSLSDQALETARALPQEVTACTSLPGVFACGLNIVHTLTSRFFMIGAALTSDVGKLTVQAGTLPAALTACGANEIFKDTAEVGDVLNDIRNCILSKTS